MATVADNGGINPHVFTGNDNGAVLYHPDYTGFVSNNRRAFLTRLIETHLPGRSFNIIGAPWNHEDPASKLNPAVNPEDAFIGHYRVDIEGLGDVAVQVEYHNAETALALGDEFFAAAESQGIKTLRAIKWPGTNIFHQNFEGCSVHMSPFAARAPRLSDPCIKVDDGHAPLGEMAGRLYRVAGSIDDEALLARFAANTDMATFDFWRKGQLSFARTFSLFDSPDRVFAEAAAGARVIPDIKDVIAPDFAEDIARRVNQVMKNPRIPTAFNTIDKQICIDTETGELILICYDTPGRGYVPMMTENASYDVGTMVHRIILNGKLYDCDPSELDQKMLHGLNDFVTAYNEQTGLSLTVEEALEAAKNSFAMLAMFACGSYAAQPDPNSTTARDALAHIKTNLADSAVRIANIDRFLALHRAAPRPGNDPVQP